MNQYVEIFEIFSNYSTNQYDLCAEHDELFFNIEPGIVSDVHIKRLEELGVEINNDSDGFHMFI